MDIENVRSTVLSAIGYDPDRQVLEARFRTGRIYHYYKVPQDIYDNLRTAPSIGRYFNKHIARKYEAELVYDPRRPY